jgi:hypothetical protein
MLGCQKQSEAGTDIFYSGSLRTPHATFLRRGNPALRSTYWEQEAALGGFRRDGVTTRHRTWRKSMISRISLALLAIGAPLLLSACGTDPTDRAVSGAGIGAATGAVVGAVTPLTPVGGALLGAAVGGAAGALTSPSEVNLGKPVWHGSAAASPAPMGAVDPAMVRDVQAELQRRGYNVGPIDGRIGPRTETAIREYEQRNGLPLDGWPSSSLLDYMQSHPTG